MCEYCEKIINNKKILDIDNDGYKPSQFFQINYCPMCGRKLVKE